MSKTRRRAERAARRDAVDMEKLALLRSYADVTLAGSVPPAEVSHFIARRFGRYLNARGRLTLDQAFGLRSIQRAGNPSKRQATAQALYWALSEIAFLRVCGRLDRYGEIIPPEREKLSIPKLVDAFISEHGRQDDAFVKCDDITLTRETLIKAYKSARGGLEPAIRGLYLGKE